MKYLLLILVVLCLVSAASADDFKLVLPSWYSYYQWGCGDFNYPVVQGVLGSTVLWGHFCDTDNWNGYSFTFAKMKGKVYRPYSDFNMFGCIGVSTCWYDGGWGTGQCIMPKGESGLASAHYFIADAYCKEKSAFTQWWKQTDTRWADDPYGNKGQSTIRANGCCATCAAMQLASWGYDTDPARLVAALIKAKDGFTGKHGLSVNWSRIQKLFGCGYRRGVPIKEALLRGMTVQAGVRHNSAGEAGHWVLVCISANGELSYIIFDPMGRGVIDTEIDRYNDGRDDGCWEKDTRMLYPKCVKLSLLSASGAAPTQFETSNVITNVSSAGPVKIDQEYVMDNLGKVALGKLMAQYIESNKPEMGITDTQASLSSEPFSSDAAGSAISIPSEESLVDWGYSSYVAFPMAGDVHLALKQGDNLVAEEYGESLENDETDEVITDYILEANPLKGGNYTLEITGNPGTAYQVQTYEYGSLNSEPMIDKLVSGTIGASGVNRYNFKHEATAFLIETAGLSYLPEGTYFVVGKYGVDVTARLATGEYAVQSSYPLVFPWKMAYAGAEAIQEFTEYRIQGRLGPNRTLLVDKVELPYAASTGYIGCPAVFRNNSQVFDPVAGCIYTKICGKLTEIGDSYMMIDEIKVNLDDVSTEASWRSWFALGTTVSICGVPVGGEFRGQSTTLFEHVDDWWNYESTSETIK